MGAEEVKKETEATKELTDEQKKLIEALAQRSSLVERIRDAVEDAKTLEKDLKDIEFERNTAAQTLLGTREQELAYELENLDIQYKQLENETQLAEMESQSLQRKIEEGELNATEIAAAEKSIEKTQELVAANREVLRTQKNSVAEQKKKLKNQSGLNDLMGSFAVKVGLSAKSTDSLLGKMITVGGNIRQNLRNTQDWKEGIKSLGSSFLDVFSITNMLSAAIGAMFKASLEFLFASSKAMAEVSAATGTAGEMSSTVASAMDYASGIDIEQSAAAFIGLAGSFTQLTSESKENRDALTLHAGRLERLGMSASATGKGLNYLMVGMGKSREEAMHFQRGLAAAASTLGKLPRQMQEDWQATTAVLSAQGDKQQQVFLALQATAKETGLAYQDVLGIASKFDTFDSAADSVGSLNAILGGDYLNSVDMMAMSESERVDALKRVLDAQGKTFNQMERYERKALAKSMGVDTAQLAQLMGSQTEEEKKAAEAAAKKMKNQEKMQKMLTSTVDLMKMIQLQFAAFFRNKDVMDAMKAGIKAIFGKDGFLIKNKDAIIGALNALGKAIGFLILVGVYLLDNVLGPFVAVILFLIKPLLAVRKGFKWLFSAGEKDGEKTLSRWKQFTGWMSKTFPTAANIVKKAGQKITAVFEGVSHIFRLLWEVIKHVGEKISNALTRMFGAMTKSGGTALKWLTSMPGKILSSLGKLPGKIIEFGPKLFKGLKWLFSQAMSKIMMVFTITSLLDSLLPDNVMGEGSVAKKIAGLVTAIISFFTLGLLSEDTTAGIMTWLGDFFTNIGDFIFGTLEEWANSDNLVKSFIGNWFGGIAVLVQSFLDMVISGFAYFGKMLNAIFFEPKETFNAVMESLEYIPGFLGYLAIQAVDAFLWPFQWLGEKIGKFFSDAYDAVVELLSGSPIDAPSSLFGKIGTALLQGIINPFDGMGAALVEKVSGAWKSVTDFLGIHSDAKVGEDAGESWMGGIIGGFKKMGSKFLKNFTGIFDLLEIPSFDEMLAGLGSLVMTMLKEISAVAFGIRDTFNIVISSILELTQSLSSMALGIPASFKTITSSILEITKAILEIPSKKIMDFVIGMESILEPAAQISNPTGAVQIIKEATKYQREVASNKDVVDGLKEILKATQGVAAASGGTTGGAAASGGGQVIQLNIDGRPLKRFILDTSRNELTTTYGS